MWRRLFAALEAFLSVLQGDVVEEPRKFDPDLLAANRPQPLPSPMVAGEPPQPEPSEWITPGRVETIGPALGEEAEPSDFDGARTDIVARAGLHAALSEDPFRAIHAPAPQTPAPQTPVPQLPSRSPQAFPPEVPAPRPPPAITPVVPMGEQPLNLAAFAGTADAAAAPSPASAEDPFTLGPQRGGGSDPAMAPVRTAEILRPKVGPDPEELAEASRELSLVPSQQLSAIRPRNVGAPPQSIWEDDAIFEGVLRDLQFEVEDAVYPGVKRVISVLEDALVNRRFDLAPFPAAAARLLGRDGPPLSDDEIIEIIKTDPALAGNVVKTANSPFYMAAMPVNSVPRAITRVGVQEARRICLATAVSSSFDIAGFEDVMAGMRTHALAAAMFAELLSAYVGQDPGEAFLAALLHDAGEVATYRLVSVGMRESEMKGEPWRPDRSLLWYLAEHYHPRVGVVFFRNWDLAATVVGAMAYHHHPNWAEDEHRRLALLVHVADLLAERSIEHAQSPQWQATVAVRGPFATDEHRAMAAHGDGVEHIPIHDLLEQLPPSFNDRRIPGLIRSVLLRLDPDELKPIGAGNWS